MPEYAAVDLGATNTRALVAGPDGTERGRTRRPTPDAEGRTVAAAVVSTLERACEAADVAPDTLTAVGVGSIGPLDTQAGAVVDSPNVAADRIDLVAAVRERTDCPVTLHNDAVAAVLGERRFTDIPPNTVYLTLSTGVGAGVAVDGHVLRGWRGNAAEVGHLTLVPEGRRCGCGGAGHWEAYCSGTGIARHARDRAAAAETTLDPATADAAAVFEAADTAVAVDIARAAGRVGAPLPEDATVTGDPLATRVVADAICVNGRGVAALAHSYAPELVSIGGAVAMSNPAVVDPLSDLLDAADLAVPTPRIRTTPLGDDAVLRGALASVLPG
jgi:glucokinase